jgi:putative ABC transport system permease protein
MMLPPKLSSRFLEWYCPSSLYEGIEGDLTEKFDHDVIQSGKRKAQLNYTLNVIKFFRPGILFRNKFPKHLFENYMWNNYLKIAFRSLWRAKIHTMINLLGLALGICCCILISLYVRDEMSFDQFHSKANRIYRVFGKEDWGEKQQYFYTVTPFPMGPALKSNLPEVESHVRVHTVNSQVKVLDHQFNESVTVAGQDFFDVFDFDLMQGDKKQVLRAQPNVVLSERYAKKYFGIADPIGKNISIQFGESFEEFEVKAVAKNPPINSSIQFDIMVSDLNYPKLYSQQLLTTSWFNIIPETYVLLQAGADVKNVESKFPSIFKTILGEEEFKKSKYAPGLQSLTDIHLNTAFPVGNAPVSNPKYSYILTAIAILILFVACINFVTLSVGRSLQRAKEVAIRKTAGAVRSQLMTQFIGEAIIVTLLSLVLGVLFTVFNLPLFNDLAGKQLSLHVDQFVVGVLAGLLAIIGLFSGSYPALVLSSFKPITILKGVVQAGNSKQNVRKILVGIQLSLSVLLISSTLLMRQQFNYVQNKDMGFDKEQLMTVQLNAPRTGGLSKRVAAGFETGERFKLELSKLPGVASLCISSHDFGNGAWVNVGFTDENKIYRNFSMNVVDENYVRTLKMQMKNGRNFSEANQADKRRSVIVNEAFVKEFGWSDAIGKKIPGKAFQDHEIIGVVKDFNFASLYTKVGPLAMVEDPMIILSGIENINVANSPIPKLLIRIKPGQVAETVDQVKGVWNRIGGGGEFNFSFVDQAMARQYQTDQNLSRIVGIATLLAVIIGSLGLYALASLALQNRTKEISIRKVMGASEGSLLYLLSREYLMLVFLCLLISVPITWYLISNWLSTFEYRVHIGADVFLVAGAISLFIALTTISIQLLKAVWTNPVNNLKYE